MRKWLIGLAIVLLVGGLTSWILARSEPEGGLREKLRDVKEAVFTQELKERALYYEVVDTGQNKCYSTRTEIECGSQLEGQDAEYAGRQASYQDNNDGTITDLNTGLMWVKEAGEKMSYQDAVERVERVKVGGYSDWRVPTIKELYSLMDFRGIDPSSMESISQNVQPFIDDDYFEFAYGDTSVGSRVIDSQWVTSSIYQSKVMGGEECFFGVNFADGRIKCYPTQNRRNAGYFVRYVRGVEYGKNLLAKRGDGTVVDEETGLVWQENDSEEGMNWGEALKYCEGLILAGESDWRLPNIKELQTIVDYGRSPDTTNSPALDRQFIASEIVNEAGQKDWPFYWSSTTHVNEQSVDSAAYIAFGRAMGYMEQLGGWIDVHGAGAQRSDPKQGSAASYPQGHGPQGDARRIDNYVRCVRGGVAKVSVGEMPSSSSEPQSYGQPPQVAVEACVGKRSGVDCSFMTPKGLLRGSCQSGIENQVFCVPETN